MELAELRPRMSSSWVRLAAFERPEGDYLTTLAEAVALESLTCLYFGSDDAEFIRF